MNDRLDRELREWLETEAAGRDDEGDRLLGALLTSRVPRLAPPAGFADGVMAAIGVHPAARPRAAFTVPRWACAAVAGLVVLCGFTGAVVSATWFLGLAAPVATLAARVAGLLTAVVSFGLGIAAHGWIAAGAISRALALAAASGPAATLIALNLTLALGASCALKRLLTPQEE